MIIGITGLAGSGKDTCADALVERRGFCKISLAAPLKRVCEYVFGWDQERLNGPSERRNEPDPAWGGLTARYALQQLGTDWGRRMHPDVWVRRCLRDARLRLEPEEGDPRGAFPGVVIPDVRFENEAVAIRAAGGKIVRIVRPGAGLTGDAAAHSSEAGVPDELVDARILNTGTLERLQNAACELPDWLWL